MILPTVFFVSDTSFMYMIAWLCMLKIYQIRHPDINASAHSAYFALSLVIFVAVIGVVSYGYLSSTNCGISLVDVCQKNSPDI
jgi:hypothetical protein